MACLQRACRNPPVDFYRPVIGTGQEGLCRSPAHATPTHVPPGQGIAGHECGEWAWDDEDVIAFCDVDCLAVYLRGRTELNCPTCDFLEAPAFFLSTLTSEDGIPCVRCMFETDDETVARWEEAEARWESEE